MLEFDQLCRRSAASGLAVRGAFHPEAGELEAAPGGATPGTVVLLGFTGGAQWSVFQASSEARDGLPHPLDRWSRRVIGALASEFGAADFYPSGSPASPLPFQRLARRCEPVHPSPIGLLIHETYGLWHAYRGGLVLRERIALPPSSPRGSPCENCADRPCLSACPVQAFRNGSFDVDACVSHVRSAAGTDCRENGCLARRACPVGPQFRYAAPQTRFHMNAFLRSVRDARPPAALGSALSLGTAMDVPPSDISYAPTTGARRLHVTPLVEATDETLEGYGALVADPQSFPIEIVPWPAQGWRPIDENSGDQGGITAGIFEFWWKGETLFARNNAVGDSYLFGWSTWPEEAKAEVTGTREHAYIWRANYHPDGGQLIYPMHGEPFVVPLALPGDDVSPDRFTTFWCDGTRGLYVRPNVWHGAFVPLADHAEFLDRQGRVHARVSVDFVKEFGCYLGAPLRRP